MRYKGFNTRAQHYVTIDGVDLGDTVDQYSSTSTYTTVTLGRVVFSSAGTHKIRLTTRGHNDAINAIQPPVTN